MTINGTRGQRWVAGVGALLAVGLTPTAAVAAPGAGAARTPQPQVSCGGVAAAAPFTWGPESSSNFAVFGSTGHRVGYRWNFFNNVPGGVQVLGFQNGTATWFTFAAPTGAGSGTVPWGNVAAVPKLKAETTTITGAAVTWSCS